MTRSAFALALALSGAAPALAEESNLRAALSVLPDTAFSAISPDVARYVDLSALAQAHGGRLDREALGRTTLGGGIRPAEALMNGTPERFAEKAGIDSAGLAFVAGTGQAPDEVSVWGFADERAAGTAYSTLPEHGFSRLSFGMIANGEPGAIDLAARDPADPWRGPMGKTSVVAQSGPALLQASNGAALEPYQSGRPALDPPAGSILAGALEAEEGTVLQAAFLGPGHGLGRGIDPALLVGKAPDEARAVLEQATAAASGGLPLWQGAALADLDTGTGAAMVIALAYADCTDAQAAADGAATLWQGMDGSAEDLAEARVAQIQPSGCAAVLRVTERDGTTGPFNRAVRALMSGSLPALRIGTGG